MKMSQANRFLNSRQYETRMMHMSSLEIRTGGRSRLSTRAQELKIKIKATFMYLGNFLLLSGTLGDISEEAVANLLRRANRSGKKKCENPLDPCDIIGKQEAEPQRNKADGDSRVGSYTMETEACSIDALRKISREEKDDGKSFLCAFTDSKEELDDSDWEDGPVPVSTSIGSHEVTIELNETLDSRRQKRSRRASVEDKELAELVHKAHLLCLIARGRLIDRACDDTLIQAALLSLLPVHLLDISKVAKLTAKHLHSLVSWFQNNFRVINTNVRRSFHSALNFAVETHEGTEEEIAALSVALFTLQSFESDNLVCVHFECCLLKTRG